MPRDLSAHPTNRRLPERHPGQPTARAGNVTLDEATRGSVRDASAEVYGKSGRDVVRDRSGKGPKRGQGAGVRRRRGRMGTM